MMVAIVGFVSLLGWALELPVLASLGSGKIPVAPSTAVMFVMVAGAIFLRILLQKSRASYWAGVSINTAGALIAALLLALSLLGIRPEAEHLGFSVVNKAGELQTGHMSPVTAVCFLLSSLSYLLSLPLSRGRRSLFNLSWWLACCLIGTGSILALAYLYGLPMLYGSVFIPPAALTSMAFIALGTALLALAAPQAWPSRPDVGSATRASYAFILVFVLLASGIVTAGYLYYRNYEKRHRVEVEHQLSAIADLKADELVHWRKERLGDAALLYQNDNFSIRVKNYFQKPKDEDTVKKLLTWLLHIREMYKYDRVFLIDAGGRVRLSVPEAPRPVTQRLILRAAEVLRTKQVTFEDFYRNEIDGRVYLAVLIPILDGQNNGRAVGTLVLRIEPEQYLYPFLNRWPIPSKTAETLLVRREGNEVLFLNELRFQKNTALNLRRSMEQKDLPAAQAVLGWQGVMEGRDYRDVPVIADVRAVPDSPWFLVSRMDVSEVYAPMREKLWMMVALVGALLTGGGGAIGLVWRRQRTEFYRERYIASEALRESEERFRILVDGVKDYAIIMLDPAGYVMSWNQGAERIKGYRDDEIIGRHFSRFYVEEDVLQGKPQRELEQAAEAGRFEDEGWRMRRDGSRFWANVVISAIRDETGQLRGFSKITRDISERKRIEDELQETLANLQRSNKDLEQFAYVASHDLQEPLRMVASYTQLLAERYENQLDDKAQKFIHYAVDGAVRMQLLINDLLTYSRIGTRGKPLERVDTNTVLEEAIKNLKMNIDEVKAVITNDALPEMRADASQLVQLFQNLISNAVKFHGTEIPRIHISAKDEGRDWLFSVRDNGIGIEQQYAEKIFIIFQRLHTKEEYQGSGIGLAICKKIVERHGGRIWFDSELGKGSTFYFTLPK
jgi:PAS domain S-box-containing protein